MMPWKPVETFLKELKSTNYYGDYNGSLGTVRTALGITTSNISVQPLSRNKNPSMAYKLTEDFGCGRTKSWVVKFSPVGKQKNPWYDVYTEYEILQGLRTPPAVPAPDPLHRSTEAETGVVGTKFIIMTFVKGKCFENAKSIPEQFREIAFTSVMRTLASDVHYYHWTASDRQTRSETFWTEQVTAWRWNYTAAMIKDTCYYSSSIADTFLECMFSAVKPSHSDSRIIHGDMTISNVIFDDQYNVKAIFDWKSIKNGDPMVDVAYLCLTFMTPGDCGDQFKPLNNHPLLLGLANSQDIESRVLAVYKTHRRSFTFSPKVFNFAKAVCCQRWLSILQAAQADHFRGHESGEYAQNKRQLVLDCLVGAGYRFYRKSR